MVAKVAVTGQEFIEAPLLVAEALQLLPTPRTGLPLASSQGTTLTYITHRLSYPVDLIERMPAIVIDTNENMRVPIRIDTTTTQASVPLVVVIFVPNFSYLEGKTDAERQEHDQAADTDIKTMFGDLLATLNTERARYGILTRLELVDSPGIAQDDMTFEGQTHIAARVAELWCRAWYRVRG